MPSEFIKAYTEKDRDTAATLCAKALKEGDLCVFPTETVYGIGCDACNEKAVDDLYIKKQRPREKALLMHIKGLETAENIAYLTDEARELTKRFTPGPLTLVLKRRKDFPDFACKNTDTIGLRFPSDKTFLKIASSFNGVIAATSANLSGRPSAVSADELKDICSGASVVVDGGRCALGLESTIISLVDKPKLLRLGSFDIKKLSEVLGECGL